MTLLSQYEKIVSSPNGLKFWSIDLHVHTPASKDSKWVEKDPFKILRLVYEAGIHCIAITDHFSGQFIDELKHARKIMSGWKEFNKVNLPTIIPGTEIEVDGVHLLCIFPEKYGTEEVNYFLGRIGVRPEDYGNQEANCTAGLGVIRDAVDEYGGLIIAAHANSDKGLMGVRGKNFVDLAKIVDIIEINRPNFERDVEGIRTHRPEVAMKPFIRGSDAHAEAGLLKGKFLLKMQSPVFASLKQMIFEPVSRFQAFNQTTVLLGVSFYSPIGIFGEQILSFNNGMNTVIGGRGDGKSILMDSLRYSLESYPSLEYLHSLEGGMLSRINGTFHDGDSISIFIRHDDEIYACVRGVAIEKLRKVYSANTPSKWYKLEAGDFTEIARPNDLRFTIYSQGEIESLTRELDLIGQICDEYSHSIKEIKDRIESSLIQLDQLFDSRSKIKRIEEVISSKKEKIITIHSDISRFEKILGNVDKSVYRKMLRAEDESVDLMKQIWHSIEEMRRTGGEIVGKVNSIREEFTEDNIFINADFESYFNHTRSTALRISEIMTFSDIGKFSDTPERMQWRIALDAEKSKYEDLIRESGMESQESLMPRLSALRKSRDLLSQEIQYDSDELAKLDSINAKMVIIIGELIKQNQELKQLRLENIKQLNLNTPEMVYLNYAQDNSDLKDWLDEALKSKGLTEKISTVNKLTSLSAMEILLAAITGDTSSLKQTGISESNASLVASAIDNIETQNLHRIDVKFAPEVGLIKGGQNFSTTTLSIGEKVSAVFPLLMINNGKPIILDQPEDDLDHNYIIDNITQSIKTNKFKQQFIIVTHNPNIPVLADSDQIIKMKRLEDEQRCIIEVQGAIENEVVRSHIMRLDGGMDAIEKRYKRYKS